MSHDDGQHDAVTDGRAVGSDVWAARSEAEGEGRPPASRAGAGGGERPGLGGLWLLLVPLACCGGPLLIAALAAAGALAWGALGLGAGVLVAVTALVIRRRRRGRARCEPGLTGCAGGQLPDGEPRDDRCEHPAGDCMRRVSAAPRWALSLGRLTRSWPPG